MLMIARFILQIPEQIQSGADNDAASSFSETRVKEREKKLRNHFKSSREIDKMEIEKFHRKSRTTRTAARWGNRRKCNK